MNRRNFFKWLGVGTAAVVVAPKVLIECEDPWCGSIGGEGIIPHDELHFDELKEAGAVCDLAEYGTRYGNYADYSSFSEIAVSSSFDDGLLQAAKELGDKLVADLNAEIARHA